MNTSIAALKRSKSNLDTLIGELNKVAEPQKLSLIPHLTLPTTTPV